MNPAFIDQWFPDELQDNYIYKLINPRRVGLTRCRAEYFVRLWAYLLLKQQELSGRLRKPLSQLTIPKGFVPCTNREAAELFYANKDRGSDRAAGMMIDILVDLGLIDKLFDGNTICIRIRPVGHLTSSNPLAEPIQFQVDGFNPRTDAVIVANFLARNYNWMSNTTNYIPFKITKLLRSWAHQYPSSMRVLRRCDTSAPVGFYMLYPTASESEEKFFLPPINSLYLSSSSTIDPLKMATPGNPDCTSVLVRSWMIDTPYITHQNVCRFLEDVQQTLVGMEADFPNLWDLYAMTIHPSYQELSMAIGFQKIGDQTNSSVSWLYTSVDQFLNLAMEKAISKLEFRCHGAESRLTG
ncbi:MAG: hypothetical protein F6K49_48335 [Moorea sp. SIO3I6]|nr:hypothetical protein [Moorena sp. SIO3I6]